MAQRTQPERSLRDDPVRREGAARRLVLAFFAGAVTLGAALLAAKPGEPALARQTVSLSHRDKLYDVAVLRGSAIAVGYPGLVLVTDADAARMRLAQVPVREALFAVDLDASTGRGVIVGRNCTVLLSADAGQNWQDASAALGSACDRAALLDAVVLPTGRLLVVGELGTILTSDDAGRSWVRRAFDATLPDRGAAPSGPAGEITAEEENEGAIEEARLSAVAFADARTGYVVGEFGLVLATTDGGEHWRRQASGTDRHLFSVVAWNSGRVLAVGAQGTVVESVDGGASWAARDAPGDATLFGIEAVGPGCLIAGERGTLLWQAAPGHAFVRRASGVFAWLEAAAFLDANTGFVVGGRGHLLRTRDGGEHFERLLGR